MPIIELIDNLFMKKNIPLKFLKAILFFFFIAVHFNSVAQNNTVKGKVLDSETGEVLIGASVVIKGTTIGSVTDIDGKFEFKTNEKPPFTLSISFIGYLSLDYEVKTFDDFLKIKIGTDQVMMDEVQVVGSRIREKQQLSALTTESMDVLAIKEAASGSFYESLGNLKGVDVTSASLGFKIVNTRGFNSTSPVRSLQLIDGVDNQSPGLNFSLGNFLGASDLDLMNVEVISGASSAYYGPGAFNGVISMTTKSPWLFRGLSAELKVGERNLWQLGVRWAQVIKNKKGEDKFAYRLNILAFRADDWVADNANPSTDSEDGESNFAGYDAVNRYGDEVLSGGNDFSGNPINFPGLGRIYRTGYWEDDILDYNTWNVKTNIGLFYKITPKTEINYSFNYSTGTTVYQGDDRFSLNDIQFFQNKLEINQNNKFFVRFYATNEDAGNSYDSFVTAQKISDLSKPESQFYQDYAGYYNPTITNRMDAAGLPNNNENKPNLGDILNSCGCSFDEALVIFAQQNLAWQAETVDLQNLWISENTDSMLVWHAESREAAEDLLANPNQNPFYQPGTQRFDSVLTSVTTALLGQGGSRLYDKSALYNVDAQYLFDAGENWHFTVGGSYRIYTPDSRGTIFEDTLTYTRERVMEIDPVTGDTTFAEVKIDSSYIKITNWNAGLYFGIQATFFEKKLIVDLTLRGDKNENFDAVFSPAMSLIYSPFKNQTFRATFSTAVRNPTMADQFLYFDVGRAILIGNLNGMDSLVTVDSFRDAINSRPVFGWNKLDFFSVAPIRPEQVKTIEFGYRGMFGDKFYVDLSYYHSWYDNFIGFNIGVDLDYNPNNPFPSTVEAFRISANATDQVTTQGVAIGANYYLGNHWVINANYSFNKLDKHGSEDPIIPAYNTPENKFNVGINGRDFVLFGVPNFGFGVNYKWIEGFIFEGSPQFTGPVDTYSLVDAQINYHLSSINLGFKLGASNVLNNKVYQVYGGPLVGRLAYFTISYDFLPK